MTPAWKRRAARSSLFDLNGDDLDGLSSEGVLRTGEEAAERLATKLKVH